MKVNAEKLDLLKEPFGILIRDQYVNKTSVIEILGNSSTIVAVGDTTTEKLIKYGIIPDVSVIDGKEKRIIKTIKLEYPVDKVLKFKNNPGELDEKIIMEVRRLVSQKERERDNTLSHKEIKVQEANEAETVEKEVGGFAETHLTSSEPGYKKTGLIDSRVTQTERESSDIEYHCRGKFATSSSEKIQMVIDGEEDIVALPFLIFAPIGWVVCYGQPNEGMVVVKITEESKKRAESIFNKVFI